MHRAVSSISFPLLLAALPALPGVLSRAQEPPVQPPPIPAAEVDQLMKLEGETRTVRGFVASTRVNVTGIHFLEFQDSSFVCVVFPRFLEHFPGGTPSELYRDKHVAVTGLLELYRGQPQIKLERADQVQVLAAPPAPAPPQPAPEPATAEGAAVPPAAPPAPETAASPSGRPLEVIDGKPALDWRLYFPE